MKTTIKLANSMIFDILILLKNICLTNYRKIDYIFVPVFIINLILISFINFLAY